MNKKDVWESSVTFQLCKITLTLFWNKMYQNNGIIPIMHVQCQRMQDCRVMNLSEHFEQFLNLQPFYCEKYNPPSMSHWNPGYVQGRGDVNLHRPRCYFYHVQVHHIWNKVLYDKQEIFLSVKIMIIRVETLHQIS